MRWKKTALVVSSGLVAAAALALTPPEKYVEEDFEGTAFPPSGWTTEHTGSATSAWERAGGGSNHYAHGYMEGGYPSGGTNTILTGNVSLEADTRLKVRFRRYCSARGTLRFYFRIILRKGATQVWKKEFLGGQSWAWLEETSPVINVTGVDYKVGWQIDALMGPSSGGRVDFYLDDIVVEKNNTAVAPASLGRVKALFR